LITSVNAAVFRDRKAGMSSVFFQGLAGPTTAALRSDFVALHDFDPTLVAVAHLRDLARAPRIVDMAVIHGITRAYSEHGK
jgi:hypothetical protein